MNPAGEPVLQAHITKHLPPINDSPAFDLQVKFEAHAGITVLLGPSGSGKSLTLNCIAGFCCPDSGRILVNDDLYFDAAAKVDVPPEQRRCGFLFQEDTLLPHMTVRQNLRFAARSARPKPKRGLQLRRALNESLEAFQIAELADRRPSQISGGQRQRAALARTMLGDPRLVLLDEPMRGVDRPLRQSFYELLRNTAAQLKIPFVVVTHDLEECFALADYICLIDRGRLLQAGPAEAVLARPDSIEVARFLGLHALFPAEVTALDPVRKTSRLRIAECEIEGPYLPGRLIGDHGLVCVLRSEMRVLGAIPRAGSNHIVLKPQSWNPSPEGMRVDLGADVSAIVSISEYQELRTAERVAVQIPAGALRFLSR